MSNEGTILVMAVDERTTEKHVARVNTSNSTCYGLAGVGIPVGAMAFFALLISLGCLGIFISTQHNGLDRYMEPFDYVGSSGGALPGVAFNLSFHRIGTLVTVCFSPLDGIVVGDGIGLAITMPVPLLSAQMTPSLKNIAWATAGVNGAIPQVISIGWDGNLGSFFARPFPGFGFSYGYGGFAYETCHSYIAPAL